jgi:hypothetical protein
MIAATGRLTNAEHDELLRQQLAAAEQSVSERRNTPDARRITVMRRQMEGVAVAHAIAQMVVTASKQAATRVAQLSNATENDEGEAEVDSHEEELLHLVELQRDVESFGTRLMTLLSTMVVEAANSTGLYTKQIEAEEAKATEGYESSQSIPSWASSIFGTAHARAETERRVAQLVRINRSTSKPPAAYYDSHSLVDVSSELRGAADSLEAVMVALSAAEQSEETNAFDTFFAAQLGEQRVGAKELLDSAMDAMDQTLDTLNAIRTKLPAQSMGGASPALARAFDGAASPVRAAAAPAAAAAAGRHPLEPCRGISCVVFWLRRQSGGIPEPPSIAGRHQPAYAVGCFSTDALHTQRYVAGSRCRLPQCDGVPESLGLLQPDSKPELSCWRHSTIDGAFVWG